MDGFKKSHEAGDIVLSIGLQPPTLPSCDSLWVSDHSLIYFTYMLRMKLHK